MKTGDKVRLTRLDEDDIADEQEIGDEGIVIDPQVIGVIKIKFGAFEKWMTTDQLEKIDD